MTSITSLAFVPFRLKLEGRCKII